MGNCTRKEEAMEWGGEDWGSLAAAASSDDDDLEAIEEKGLLKHTSSSYKKMMTTEVKIKITKKQLEELLGKADIQGLSVQQVLAHLIKASDGYESHQRTWRPALSSIPEST